MKRDWNIGEGSIGEMHVDGLMGWDQTVQSFMPPVNAHQRASAVQGGTQ